MAVFRALAPLVVLATLAATPVRAEGPDLGEQDLGKRGWLKHYKEEIETAWAGDCAPLLAAARPNEPLTANEEGVIPLEEKTRGLLAMDMWDRGLCVRKDPGRGAAIDTVLAAAVWAEPHLDYYGFELRPYLLEHGWRTWHGYGRPRDEAIARAALAEGLLRSYWVWKTPEFGVTTRLGRPLPPYGVRVANWIKEQMASDDTKIAFAVGLFRDGVTLPEGVRVEPIPGIGDSILTVMTHSAEASYQQALALRDGLLGEERYSSWTGRMDFAAQCGHVKAILEMVDHELALGAGGVPGATHTAVAWLWLLFDRGYDTLPKIREISEKFGVSGTRESYLGLLVILEARPPDCA